MLLSARGLDKMFGGVVAARNVSFEVDRGQMVAIIGPNGAGKSTTFNMVGGQIRPDRGHVMLDGADITGAPARTVWRLGVGRTFQVAQTFHSMTVGENVQVALQAHRGATWSPRGLAHEEGRAEAQQLVASVGMAAAFDRFVATLAYGDVKRVELAVALASEPKLLLMDEPTAGMAPRERGELMGLVGRLARERALGVLFTEHDMDAVFGHADRILVMVRGEIVAGGTPQEVRADPLVRKVYLGELGAAVAENAERGGRP
ncbi:MAG: ABC transporter ATP-binding protein [Hyphomicrobiales bacterium]|nr:ABC transporter ATP-binding protein [Hyphomicrobiales bacterium]